MITELETKNQALDREALEEIYQQWKAGVFERFPGCGIKDAIALDTRGQCRKFVAIAAMPDEEKDKPLVLAIWAAESTDVGTADQRVSITAKIFDEPVPAEDLPKPFCIIATA